MAPLGNLLMSGHFIKKGKYIPHMSVDVYDSGHVVIHDGMGAYDGNTDNLVTYCKGGGMEVVPTTTYAVNSGIDAADACDDAHPPVKEEAVDSTPEERQQVDGNGSLQPVKEEEVPETPQPVKEEGALAASHHAAVDGESGGQPAFVLHKHQLFMSQSIMVLHELVQASHEGREPDRKMIDEVMLIRGPAVRAFETPPGVRKRNGDIKDLFEKLRNTPDEKLFTRDVSSLYPNKRVRDSALEDASYWRYLASKYG